MDGDEMDGQVEIEEHEPLVVEEAEHPPPVNQDPNFIYEYLQQAGDFLSSYGWFVLFALVVAVYLWKKYEPKISEWQDKREAARHKKDLDADVIERRQQAQAARLQKLQEEHDKKAALHAVKVAEVEEQKRKEKLEDWDRHQKGLGYRSKIKKEDDASGSSTTVIKGKKKLQGSDYSPLMGPTTSNDSCSWRPSRRGPAGGGGG